MTFNILDYIHDDAPAAAEVLTPPRTFVPASMPNGYLGDELKADTLRPGSMDAYRLPSLINGQRVVRGAA